MNVISKKVYQAFCRSHGRLSDEGFFDVWHKTCVHARWTCFADVRTSLPKTDVPGNDRLIFDVRGNRYRIVVAVLYARPGGNGVLWIKWVGTHSEYDKIAPLTI
ncbi:type II toxin-antitoxin system HigB family toxin [soil metagenome]